MVGIEPVRTFGQGFGAFQSLLRNLSVFLDLNEGGSGDFQPFSVKMHDSFQGFTNYWYLSLV